MDLAVRQGRIDKSLTEVLDSAPRGFPRPLTGSLPTPWISREGDLGDVDAFRRAVAVMMRLCQVCGDPLGEFSTVYWRRADRIVIDGAALHPAPCAVLAERHCPELGRLRDAGRLRKATVLTSQLMPADAGTEAADLGMPRGYEVPV